MLDKAFYDKWVVPFYMAFMGGRSPLGEQLDHFNCIALATFNSKTGVSFFTRYLDHYLRQVDLWFDQGDVLAALTYLDQKNGTNHASLFQSRWQTFIANKPNRDLSRDIENFTAIMDGVNELRAVLVA